MNHQIRLLLVSAALAAGEGLGALFPTFCDAYPVVAAALVFVILLGYGFSCRGWHLAAVFLFGLLAFQLAARERESTLRASPWLRTSRRTQAGCVADHPLVAPARSARRSLSRRVGLGLEHARDVAQLNRAILLGERGRLPRQLRNLFADAGTIHVFAISGLHVMIVAKTLVILLSALLCPLRFAGLVAIPILWAYVAVIGFPPSAVRAGTMASIYFLAPVFWRKPDLLRAWSLTFLLVHLVNPLGIADVGSLLSFAVMLAIALACALPGRPASALGSALWISLAAWSAGVPIVAHVFGRITPGGLLANFALIPAAEVTVSAGVVGTLASFVSETLAAHLNNLSALFTVLMVEISRATASLPGANIVVAPWSIGGCLAYYLALALAVWLYIRLRSRRCF